jgi:glycosyltransferase involved in cell wall biosynthesis
MNKSDISIIIPSYNEAENIGNVVKRIIEHYPGAEIIVINDGSTDSTANEAKKAGASVYNHPYNIGNGAAIKTGIRHASGRILVFMDGDGQHDPEDIKEFLKYIQDYDMVVGARRSNQHASWGRAIGNWFYNRLASYVAKFPIRDLTSGFRAIKADIAVSFLYFLPNTYSYPTTLTLGVLRSGLSLKYIPIRAQQRKSGKSSINLLSDGIRFFLIITKICTLYSPFRVFLPVSFITFIVGVFYYLYTFITAGRFTNMGVLLFTTSVIIFMLGMISEQISQLRFERRRTTDFISKS